ncbi:MAG TPA: protein TolQ [Leucothrix mucor]|uniref:Tol-Pal system protein TolQ n=1 Tax=Leucothrix mucor TaxID=45248 RepID=A0A7V2WVA3_LEUMU|nr:protein TolQ [Leucothrix mucor]
MIKLISEASLIVQIVMAILVIASLLSWAVMLIKSSQLRSASRQLEKFEDRFWSGVSLKKLYDDLAHRPKRFGMEKIFFSGYHEYLRIQKNENITHLPMIATAQRAMRVAESRELDRLEQNLSFLATVGSISTYIGLFGTVWGIMNSFISLGKMQQATLAVVAPGIAEALIATAIGLLAAIPAIVAYNRYSDKVDRIAVRYENFREEFTTLLERQTFQKSS